jgi:hypothetical protein
MSKVLPDGDDFRFSLRSITLIHRVNLRVVCSFPEGLSRLMTAGSAEPAYYGLR